MASFEFFFDYGSPYSYLADTRIAGVIARTGADVAYRPMLLGGVFKATGNASPFVEPVDAKRRYFSLELNRCVAEMGVAFRSNPYFPIDTLQLMRCAHAAVQMDVFPAFHEGVYAAFWTRGAALGETDVIESVLDGAGLDGQEILAAAGTDTVKASLRKTTDEAVSRGIFGAPSFFVGDELFFGNDRVDLMEARLDGR